MTIHNLAFQGQFSADLLGAIGLPPSAYGVDCVEYYGDISYLKGGLMTADHITVVSPTYAREILTPTFGMGLHGVLAQAHRPAAGHRQRHRPGGVESGGGHATCPCRMMPRRSAARRRTRPRAEAVRAGARQQAALFRRQPLTWQKGMDVLAEVADGSSVPTAG